MNTCSRCFYSVPIGTQADTNSFIGPCTNGHQLSTVQPVLSAENLKATLKEAIKETEDEKERGTLSFSTVSESKVIKYLEFIDVIMLAADPLDPVENHTVAFQPFFWQASEDADTPRAIAHLQQELQKFGVVFGRNNYQMYDVHSKHGILSVRDDKSGSLSGGTDLIIAPYGIDILSSPKLSCVAFEFKTEEAVAKYGLESFLSQATMELIASNYHSRQMTLVVSTDLRTKSIMLTLTRIADNIAIMKYNDVTLDQMANFVRAHLENNCTSFKGYSLPAVDEGIRESEMTMKAWKRARVSDFTLSLQWEHFQEMMEDAPLGSKERAMAIRNHFQHHDLPDTSYLSMFS